ncbi:tetratricopeptide repeat-containing sensor histidine kinase [Psychroserpens mesophilus]|uniref:tetratricopeptide repeat-containing sensor histidine kinase n=1 Tax=Psychroserpens mesophilus TaxID=325473 RepID=UPI003D6483A6
MRHTILLFVFFGLSFSVATAQQKRMDSLQQVISNCKVIDTGYVNTRNSLAVDMLILTPNDSTIIPFCLKTLEVSDSLGYKKGQMLTYEKIGIWHHYISGNPYAALEYYHKGLTVAENHSNLKKYTSGLYANIGSIYYDQQEYEKAIPLFQTIIKDKNKAQYPVAYMNMANSYSELKKPDSAMVNYHKAIQSCKEVSNNLVLTTALSNLAATEIRNNKNDSALKHINQSLKLVDSLNLNFLKAAVYANAAFVYLENHLITEGEEYANKALENKEYLEGNLFIQEMLWRTFTDVYVAKSDYKNAYEAYRKSVVLKDSMASESKRLEIAKRDIQLENDKKIALAQAEIDRQKLIKTGSILGGSLLLLFIGVGVFFYKRRRDALDKQQTAEYKSSVAETELKALRSQMNPHFIFNSLNSIGDYISKNDTDKAKTYLSKFAKIMRQTLENSNEKEISLEEDLNLLENYMQMENQRLGGKFTYSISVDKQIDRENVLVPPMILQPFVENSIWHGISKKESRGNITIRIGKDNDILLCIVEDDGIGIQENEDNPRNLKKSLGQNITQKRIEIINKNKNTNGNVTIQNKSNGQGVKVEVRLPLEMAF